MKLRRKWPAICIFCIFLIFDLVMIASCSFFSGLFPAKDIYMYIGGFTVLSVAIMGVLTLLLGKAADAIDARSLSKKVPFKILYAVMLIAILVGGIVYRADLLMRTTAAPSGKLSLYENATIWGQKSEEFEILSILYSKLLSFVLLFTGNKISVAFCFEIFLFTVFILCGAFAVRMLLGKTASLAFAAYTSFMPLFSDNIAKLKLTTDNLFLVLFGIELLITAFYLKGVAKKAYRSKAFVIFYIFVGAVVGFMTYMDAGTFIMILPLLLAAPFIVESRPETEILRLLWVALGIVCAFAGMIIQEAGFMQADVTLAKWGAYYFHNLNTFSVFWSYTDYKLIYIITLVVMSGVIVGFWKNRKVEQISCWLLSLMIVFATVPFMGATRMNDQILVTIYYAFIIACVASLIVLPADEGEEIAAASDADEVGAEAVGAGKEAASGISDIVVPTEPLKSTESLKSDEPLKSNEPLKSPEEIRENLGIMPEEISETKAESPAEKAEEIKEETKEEVIEKAEETKEEVIEKAEETKEEVIEKVEETKEETLEKIEETKENLVKQINEINKGAEEPRVRERSPRFVPEGMVVPEDDDDGRPREDKPRMKMPNFEGTISLNRKEINRALEQKNKEDRRRKEKLRKEKRAAERKDDFDIAFRAGDDFDI